MLLYVEIALCQSPKSADIAALNEGDLAASNLINAVALHAVSHPEVTVRKQEPAVANELPPMLLYRDNHLAFDWTSGQHARYLMEEIRQGLHALQVYGKPNIGDIIALDPARKVWPKLREISCADQPNSRYFDLDGVAMYCPKD